MNYQILALYDITAIQLYIFQTSKLKDIIGASALVGNALREKIEETLGGYEILYTGGGNAILGFDCRKEWKAFNARLSKKLLMEIPGLSFVTVCNDDAKAAIPDRINDLYAQIAQKKSLGGDDCSINTLPPMAQSASERIPVVIMETDPVDAGDYSHAAWLKREEGKNAIARFGGPTELDKIAKKPEGLDNAERIMAVVHIDGNRMGDLFKDACDGENALQNIAELSERVRNAFYKSFEKMSEGIPGNHWRKIYMAGDDVTYVCHGVYALKSVIDFLTEFNEIVSDEKNKLPPNLSVSAGIAYVKPHFPFDRAYEIAERRCKSAKREAREQEDTGSWFDFEIVRGSQSAESLSGTRMRPYCVTGQSRKNDVKKLQNWLHTIQDKAGARSKWKALRSAYLTGNMDSVKKLMESCGLTPPGKDEESVAFDALDLMDVEVSRNGNNTSEGGGAK